MFATAIMYAVNVWLISRMLNKVMQRFNKYDEMQAECLLKELPLEYFVHDLILLWQAEKNCVSGACALKDTIKGKYFRFMDLACSRGLEYYE